MYTGQGLYRQYDQKGETCIPDCQTGTCKNDIHVHNLINNSVEREVIR